MIILILGGIGSGKTLSAVRQIVKQGDFCFTNFALTRYKNYHRIKFDDIINKAEKKKDCSVNWEFWEEQQKKHGSFSLYLDEVHNIIHSRRSMSGTNVLMSKWVSQIRKIMMDKENAHLYLISQTMRKIDVDFRELSQIIIYCSMITDKSGKKFVKQDWYDGLTCFEYGKKAFSYAFNPEPYFKYYNTLEMVKFSDAEIYV